MKNKTYEVRIHYRGFNTYLVKAGTPEQAKKKAMTRYQNGDNGDPTGGESEDVSECQVEELKEEKVS